MLYLIRCPSTGGSLNSIPNKIETFEPTIRRGFIPNLAPDPLLGIQPGLITRQVPQAKSHMSSYKQVNFLSLMPSGPVHIKPNRIASESAIKILQASNKSPSISSEPSDHPSPTQQRGDPSKQIQSLAILVRGRNAQALSSPRPPHTLPRMKRKSRLVLKDADLGAPSLHTIIGLANPALSLSDFLSKSVTTLRETVLEMPIPNLFLISGTRNKLDIANLAHEHEAEMLRAISGLDYDLDN